MDGGRGRQDQLFVSWQCEDQGKGGILDWQFWGELVFGFCLRGYLFSNELTFYIDFLNKIVKERSLEYNLKKEI